MKTRLLFLIFIFLNSVLIAQQECGTDMSSVRGHVLMDKLRNNDPNKLFTVPVVVHIVCHNSDINGSPLCNSNIEVARAFVNEQIGYLNKAFRNESPNRGNLTPDFDSRSSDSKIFFALATQNNGNISGGIQRRFTTGHMDPYKYSSDNTGDADEVKKYSTGGLDQLPYTTHLNIWVCDLELGGYGVPVHSPNFSDDIKGVVVDHERFFDEGSTLVHEVGHFLHLLHTWGNCAYDETLEEWPNCCDCDDGFEDTPPQRRPSYRSLGAHWQSPCAQSGVVNNFNGEDFSCASSSGGNNGCNTPGSGATNVQFGVMYQNYMDYSNGGCRSMFTNDQSEKMRAVLSPQFGLQFDYYNWSYNNYLGTQNLVPTLTYGVPKVIDFSNALPTTLGEPLPTCDGDVKLCVFAEVEVPPSGSIIVIYDKVNGSLISDVGSEITYTDINGAIQTLCDKNSYDSGDVTNNTAPYMPYYRVDDMAPGSTARIRTWDYTNYTTDDADIDAFKIIVNQVLTPTTISGLPNLKPFTGAGSMINHTVTQGTNDASINLTMDVTNDGVGPNLNPFFVQVYLSSNETLEYEGSWNGAGGDRLIGSKVVHSVLQPGDRAQVNFNVQSLKAIGYNEKNKRNIVVSIDVLDDVRELDEQDNNYVFVNALIKNPTGGTNITLPDLQVLSLPNTSDEGVPGANFLAMAKVKNHTGIGFNANNQLLLNYSISDNNRCGVNNRVLSQVTIFEALLQGKKPITDGASNFTIPQDLVVGQPYWICAEIDAAKVVDEGINEGGSNCRCQEISIVNQLSSPNNLRIQTSPNPARDYTTIVSNEAFEENSVIELVSLSGNVMSRDQPSPGGYTYELKTIGLEGVYIVVVRTTGKLATQRLVVVK